MRRTFFAAVAIACLLLATVGSLADQQVMIYDGSSSYCNLGPWGNGSAKTSDRASFLSKRAAEITTRGYYEGGLFDLREPFDLAPFLQTPSTSYLVLVVQAEASGGRHHHGFGRFRRGEGGPGGGGMMGPRGGMMGPGGGMMGPNGQRMGPGGGMMGPNGQMMGPGGGMMGPNGRMMGPGGGMMGPNGQMMGPGGMGQGRIQVQPQNGQGNGGNEGEQGGQEEQGGQGVQPGQAQPGMMGPGGGMMGPGGGMMGPGRMGPGQMGPGGMMGQGRMGPGGMGQMGPGQMGPGGMMGPGGRMGPGGMMGPGGRGGRGGFRGFRRGQNTEPVSKVRAVLETDKGLIDCGAVDIDPDAVEAEGWSRIVIPVKGFKGDGKLADAKVLGLALFGNVDGTFNVGRAWMTQENASLVADPGPERRRVHTHEEVTFQAAPQVGNVKARYSWDFDDIDGIGEDALGPTATWRFDDPGLYVVTLTVTDPAAVKTPKVAHVYVLAEK